MNASFNNESVVDLKPKENEENWFQKAKSFE